MRAFGRGLVFWACACAVSFGEVLSAPLEVAHFRLEEDPEHPCPTECLGTYEVEQLIDECLAKDANVTAGCSYYLTTTTPLLNSQQPLKDNWCAYRLLSRGMTHDYIVQVAVVFNLNVTDIAHQVAESGQELLELEVSVVPSSESPGYAALRPTLSPLPLSQMIFYSGILGQAEAANFEQAGCPYRPVTKSDEIPRHPKEGQDPAMPAEVAKGALNQAVYGMEGYVLLDESTNKVTFNATGLLRDREGKLMLQPDTDLKTFYFKFDDGRLGDNIKIVTSAELKMIGKRRCTLDQNRKCQP